mmetsp:Transcript_15916/g.20347  ORF Transcript_15916/g.20347 Transcript_15916/m.20347 type:complete len:302 (-) Transcript_15916:624-1529(-)
MTFAQRYPYHQQVNPFQIQAIHANDESIDIEDFVRTWYQVGDWQDTLQFPHSSLSSIDIAIRFQADQFTGKMVEHCYMLDHEDSESKGVMAAFNVYGEVGTYWHEGRRVDPTCIEPARRTKFSSDSKSGKSKGSGSSTSKSNKSSKSKQSKKGQSTSGETGNSTLFTSTNATNSVGSVSLYPTTVTPPSEILPTHLPHRRSQMWIPKTRLPLHLRLRPNPNHLYLNLSHLTIRHLLPPRQLLLRQGLILRKSCPMLVSLQLQTRLTKNHLHCHRKPRLPLPALRVHSFRCSPWLVLLFLCL